MTVVARGARLAQLQTDGAILTTSGDRAEVCLECSWTLLCVTCQN